MHDLGLKTSVQTFGAFVRFTLMGNQPWPQFQNGIRERSIGISRIKQIDTSHVIQIDISRVIEIDISRVNQIDISHVNQSDILRVNQIV